MIRSEILSICRKNEWNEGKERKLVGRRTKRRRKISSTTLFYIGHLFAIKPRDVA